MSFEEYMALAKYKERMKKTLVKEPIIKKKKNTPVVDVIRQ